MARKSVVSGPSTKFHASHTSKAFAEVDRPAYTRQVHDPDPAKDLLERPRAIHGQGSRAGRLESPVGRHATGAPLPLAHVHAPNLKLDSPPRSPQSAKLEAERAARLPPGGGLPTETPERATQRNEGGLAFVKDDVAAGATAIVEVRPRERFLPRALRIHKEPEGVGAVERSHWQVFSLTVGTRECLSHELRRVGGIPADQIDDASFEFIPCPAGVSIILRARNESGRPACFQALLEGEVLPEETSNGLPPAREPRALPEHAGDHSTS